jgi:hypothetical protein
LRLILLFFATFLISCKQKKESTVIPEKKTESNIEFEKPIKKILIDRTNLGEDIAEINCYVKKIYRKDNLTFVDIDIVQVELTPEGERTIINQNSKIRTYIIDDNTIISSNKCEKLKPKQLIGIEKSFLNDKSIIVIGSSKDGIMESINFGCYG